MKDGTSKALAAAEAFLRRLLRETDAAPMDIAAPGMLLSTAGEGTIHLSPTEVEEYRDVAGGLVDARGGTDVLSVSAASRMLRDALFFTLNPGGDSVASENERLRAALQQLSERLRQPAEEYSVFVPVEGVDVEDLPRSVGTASFCVFAGTAADSFRMAAASHRVSDEQKRLRLASIDETEAKLAKQVLCASIVRAVDATAAVSQAERATRIVVDALNFYSDLIPYNKGWLYLPGDACRASILTPVLNRATGSYFLPREKRGPLSAMSLADLEAADKSKGLGYSRFSQLLGGRMNGLEGAVVSAARWAGRASTERRPELAFLLYAIALESVMLLEREPQELGYRLRLRVAHLLGEDRHERRAIAGTISSLYRVRSKIVHNGSFEVAEDDLAELRAATKACIIRLLQDPKFTSLRSEPELLDWFDSQVFG